MQPATLPVDDSNSYAGYTCIITGWGSTGTDISKHLLSVILKLLISSQLYLELFMRLRRLRFRFRILSALELKHYSELKHYVIAFLFVGLHAWNSVHAQSRETKGFLLKPAYDAFATLLRA